MKHQRLSVCGASPLFGADVLSVEAFQGLFVTITTVTPRAVGRVNSIDSYITWENTQT